MEVARGFQLFQTDQRSLVRWAAAQVQQIVGALGWWATLVTSCKNTGAKGRRFMGPQVIPPSLGIPHVVKHEKPSAINEANIWWWIFANTK